MSVTRSARSALVVADGHVSPPPNALPARRSPELLVVAADGGALKAEALGLRPDVVVGDFDSLQTARVDQLVGEGVEVLRHPAAKDESDTELALLEAVRRGATTVTIMGALGGHRFEHSLANVLLLTSPELAGVDVSIVDGATTVRAMGGGTTREIAGSAGDFVSLLPVSDAVRGVTTSGLAFPLVDDVLARGPARGLSNVMLGERATVAIGEGSLIVVHTRRHQVQAPGG